jgi:hypothetical protein
MREMHPQNNDPPLLPADLGPGLQASNADVMKALGKCACPSMDWSGWTLDLFKPVRGRLDIMVPIQHLLCVITNCEISERAFWYVTPGSLVAVHKESHADQLQTELLGRDPKLRPVNKAGFLWKVATQVALNHEQAQAVSATCTQTRRASGLNMV